ncbi:VIT1/CCC1 transporter family protein [Candidatus Kaiserbacteria bacterium]|nr:VIT1/CCC1 transporter family protein [Candidatus Kaiserbacteria bacterium]
MQAAYFRNFIFGVEDSLVSTVGLLSGVAIAGVARETILLTGIVLIFVEAFSMAAGSFLSETSAEEFTTKREATASGTLLGGVIMFGSYFAAGFIPLFPYLFVEGQSAFILSVAASVCALFVLGFVSGALSRTSLLKSALRMAIIGGIAIAVGVTVGSYLG